MEAPYLTFLSRAAAGMAAIGAQSLSGSRLDRESPHWADGWDEVLLVDAAGTATIYAFTRADTPADDLSERVDRLTGGMANAGLFSHGTVNLVAIIALPPDAPNTVRRAVTRLAPRTFYAGLRPYSWVVDLSTGEVRSRRSPGQPQGRGLIQQAVDADGAVMDPATIQRAQAEHGQQLTAFRALMRGRQPFVTYALIAANVAMFLLIYLAGGSYDQHLIQFGALVPDMVKGGEWWRLFTAMFLHAGLTHIVFNMTSLFVVGSLAERLYGSPKFLAIYLGSGLIASFAGFGSSLLAGDLSNPHVGASGAIFGIAGALITTRFQPSDVIPQELRRQISSSMMMLVLINVVVLSFTPNIDNAAHGGGLVGGVLLSFAFPLTRRLPARAP